LIAGIVRLLRALTWYCSGCGPADLGNGRIRMTYLGSMIRHGVIATPFGQSGFVVVGT
jgi:hypothetical protein